MAYSTEFITATYAAGGVLGGYQPGVDYTLWIDRVETDKGIEIHILHNPTHQIKVRYLSVADFHRDWINIQPKE